MKHLLLSGMLLFGGCGGGGSSAGPVPAAPPLVRVDAIGDSLTAGVGTDNPATDAFPIVLGTDIGAASVSPLTQFIPPGKGTTTSQVAMDYEVPNLQPVATVVVIELGTNDVARFEEGTPPDLTTREGTWTQILATTRATHPGAQIVVLTVRQFVWLGTAAMPGYIHGWNDNIRAQAAKYGATVLDMETDPQWYLPGEWAAGNIHPTTTGARHIAAAIAALLH